MKGENRLTLCQAEMKVALQEYVARRTAPSYQAPVVTAVTEDKTTSQFHISLLGTDKI